MIETDDAATTNAAWDAAVRGLATTPLAAADRAAIPHELLPGTNSIEFDKLGTDNFKPLGQAFVSKDGGDWTEEWFVEDDDFFLNFGATAVAEVKFEADTADPSVYSVGGATRYASLEFNYVALPSESEVASLPTPPKTDYATASIAVYGKPSAATSNPAETAWLFREINTAKTPAVITEHWVLSANYKPPSSGYSSIQLKSEGTYADYTDLAAFLAKLIDVRGGAAGWAYVQVSFSLTQP